MKVRILKKKMKMKGEYFEKKNTENECEYFEKKNTENEGEYFEKKNTENEGKQGVTPGACPSLRDIRLSERVIALLVENLKFAIN